VLQLTFKGCVYMQAKHTRHIDIKRSKRSHSRVEVIPEADVYVAHLFFVHFALAPLGERLEELLDGNKKTCYSRFDCGLQPR
jgi:hypothetical protein